MNEISRYYCNIENKTIFQMRVSCVFPNFEYYLKIKHLLYPDQTQAEFDKMLTSKYKIKKENHFVKEIFSFLYGIFTSK